MRNLPETLSSERVPSFQSDSLRSRDDPSGEHNREPSGPALRSVRQAVNAALGEDLPEKRMCQGSVAYHILNPYLEEDGPRGDETVQESDDQDCAKASGVARSRGCWWRRTGRKGKAGGNLAIFLDQAAVRCNSRVSLGVPYLLCGN